MGYKILGFTIGILLYAGAFSITFTLFGIFFFSYYSLWPAVLVPLTLLLLSYYLKSLYPNFLGGLFWSSVIGLIGLGGISFLDTLGNYYSHLVYGLPFPERELKIALYGSIALLIVLGYIIFRFWKSRSLN